MADNSRRSWFRRAVSEGVDRLFLGNRGHDFQSGDWNARGAIQGGIEGVAGAALGPLGRIGARIGNNAYDASRFTGVLPNGGGRLAGLVTNPGATANWTPNQYAQVGGMTPVVGGWASNGPAPGRGGLSNLIANPGANVDWTPNAQSDPWAGQQQQMAATMAAREAQGYGPQPAPNYRAAQDSFRAMRGDYASPNNFQSGSGASIFGGGGRYNF
jgi:hypothetical protein